MTWRSAWSHRAVLALAVALFVTLAWRQSDAFMGWDEEIDTHSVPAPRVLAATLDPVGRPQMEPACDDPAPPRFVLSSGRPRLSVCAAGRRWPLMVAPYFSGVFYWPFAALRPVHHDDLFALRKLTLWLGVATLLLTYAVVRRLSDGRTAAMVALATAVSPCYVFLHAILVHFETLPWTLLLGATLALTGGDRRAPSTARLVGAGLLTGLAVLANLKTVVLLGPLALVAWRLAPRASISLRPRQIALTAVAVALPLVPMVVVYLLPAQGYGDKSTGWTRTLVAHLTQPQRIGPSVRDMVLWWSNVAYYFRMFVVRAPLNLAALAVCGGALAFTLVDGARTLRRREGDGVTAACAACLASYALMVALLYEEFPANYTPLYGVFGVTAGVAAARVTAWSTRRAPLVATPLAALLLAPLAWSSVQNAESSRAFFLHTNPVTERAIAAHLLAHPDPRTPLVTVYPRFAGVIDSLTRGAVRTTQAQNYFGRCNNADDPTAPACVEQHWEGLIAGYGGSLRAVIPLDTERWQSRHVPHEPAVLAAARALGCGAAREATFTTAGGLPALALYRITPPAAGGLPRAPLR